MKYRLIGIDSSEQICPTDTLLTVGLELPLSKLDIFKESQGNCFKLAENFNHHAVVITKEQLETYSTLDLSFLAFCSIYHRFTDNGNHLFVLTRSHGLSKKDFMFQVLQRDETINENELEERLVVLDDTENRHPLLSSTQHLANHLSNKKEVNNNEND